MDTPSVAEIKTQVKAGFDWKFIVKVLVALVAINFVLELLASNASTAIVVAFVNRPLSSIKALIGKKPATTS